MLQIMFTLALKLFQVRAKRVQIRENIGENFINWPGRVRITFDIPGTLSSLKVTCTTWSTVDLGVKATWKRAWPAATTWVGRGRYSGGAERTWISSEPSPASLASTRV